MFRRLLTLVAAALTAAAFPARAHAFGPAFQTFTTRAAYLAAVATQGATSRPQITSGATAVGTSTGGRVGGANGVAYATSSAGATFTPRTTGGVFDLATGLDSAATFSFDGSRLGDIPFGSYGLGLSFRAGTPGTFTFTAGNFVNHDTRTFTLAAGDEGFFGYLMDAGQMPFFDAVSLAVQPNATATVTGLDVADAPRVTPPATVTPEPASLALTGAGLAGIGLVARRRGARRTA